MGYRRAREGPVGSLGVNRAPSESSAVAPSTVPLALGCVALWLAAAASTRLLGIWLSIGGAAVVLGTAVLALDRTASSATLRPSPLLLMIGAVVGGLMTGATYLLYPGLVTIAPSIARDTAFLYAAFRAPSLAVASLALAPVILGEELVWRGVVQNALVRRLGPSLGVSLAAVAYALAHAPLGSPVLVLAALLCGLCWGALRVASGSLVPTLVAHLLWDALVLLWLPLDRRW
jgi:membrane protease YdiL (CAAX protease family)